MTGQEQSGASRMGSLLRYIVILQVLALAVVAQLLFGQFMGAFSPAMGWFTIVALWAAAGPAGLAVRLLTSPERGSNAALA